MRGKRLLIFILGLLLANPIRVLCQQMDTLQNFHPKYLTCKLTSPIFIAFFERVPTKYSRRPQRTIEIKRKELLSITGEAGYQHFEREASADNLSLINSSCDIATLRLNLLYKETYPFTVSVRYNSSRPFQLDDQYEVDLGFDNRSYKQLTQQKIINSIKNKFSQKQHALISDYEKIFREYQLQKQMLKSPVYLQHAIENRLRSSTGINTPGVDRLKELTPGSVLTELPAASQMEEKIKDSAKSLLKGRGDELYTQLSSKRDSLEKLVKKIEDSIALTKKQLDKSLDSANKIMSELQTSDELKKYADEKGLRDSLHMDKWADVLMKTNLRLGKFILNQSELTINNIFLHGASLKFGEEKFLMISGGFYDFAFRELFNFRGRDSVQQGRPTVLGIKIGKTDGRDLQAVNFYIGRKSKTGSLNDELRTVAGLGVERKWYFSKNFSLDLEIAKSTTRQNNSGKEERTFKDLFTTFSSKTIGLYSSLRAYLPKTKTDAEFLYKYWGKQFESFNASQYFNPQNNLSVKLSQPLFNRRLYLSGGARYTDFSSPGISSNIKTKTFFASANATLRLKKLPIVSIGYYPGSQLYWLDQAKLYEYFYYILNATISHNFRLGKVPMQTVFSYNKFFNKYSDSLVSGSQSYYNFFWTAWKNNFSYTMNFSRQEVENSLLSTIESGINYLGPKIRMGGSLKWNYIESAVRMGYSLNLGWSVGRIATINFLYDKSFLPERTGVFIPVQTGQIQIIKPLKFRIWQ